MFSIKRNDALSLLQETVELFNNEMVMALANVQKHAAFRQTDASIPIVRGNPESKSPGELTELLTQHAQALGTYRGAIRLHAEECRVFCQDEASLLSTVEKLQHDLKQARRDRIQATLRAQQLQQSLSDTFQEITRI
jgi:hypothetical protein